MDIREAIKKAKELKKALEPSGYGKSENSTTLIQNALDYDWCQDICMLTQGQAELCEVKIPCPKYGLKNNK